MNEETFWIIYIISTAVALIVFSVVLVDDAYDVLFVIAYFVSTLSLRYRYEREKNL